MLLASKSGDKLAREEIITRYKPFVFKVVSKICGEFINSSDDEASVGLIAFNEAIDNYTPEKGASFFTFAEIVIRRRLIDFFRKERNSNIPLSSLAKELEDELNVVQFEQSEQIYKNEQEIRDRQEEILLYQNVLKNYGISMNDLVKVSPKHRDARSRALEVANLIATDDSLRNYLLMKKELPLKALVSRVNISRKTLERQRKYIIALTIIMLYEFPMLREYIKIEK